MSHAFHSLHRIRCFFPLSKHTHTFSKQRQWSPNRVVIICFLNDNHFPVRRVPARRMHRYMPRVWSLTTWATAVWVTVSECHWSTSELTMWEHNLTAGTVTHHRYSGGECFPRFKHFFLLLMIKNCEVSGYAGCQEEWVSECESRRREGAWNTHTHTHTSTGWRMKPEQKACMARVTPWLYHQLLLLP
jgi:hypothetical protein